MEEPCFDLEGRRYWLFYLCISISQSLKMHMLILIQELEVIFFSCSLQGYLALPL